MNADGSTVAPDCPCDLAPAPQCDLAPAAVWALLKADPSSTPKYGLSSGGALWFKNLTEPDSLFPPLLPALAVMCSYTALEVGFRVNDVAARVSASRRLTLPRTIKGLFQGFFIFGFPVFATMPAAIFWYWIPGSLVSMAQAAAMRSPVVLRAIGIKP